MKKLITLKGQRFGKLIVISQKLNHVVCKCDCGNMCIVKSKNLVRKDRGATKSCGCLVIEKAKLNQKKAIIAITKHGETSKGNKTRLYSIWQNIKSRTTNHRNIHYKNYGGRGIRLCGEWKVASIFIAWARTHGYLDNLEIDRIDNDKGYSPDNCRWVTHAENMSNRKEIPDSGIFFSAERNKYYIRLQRHNKKYFGGYTTTIENARILRLNLLDKIDNADQMEKNLQRTGAT